MFRLTHVCRMPACIGLLVGFFGAWNHSVVGVPRDLRRVEPLLDTDFDDRTPQPLSELGRQSIREGATITAEVGGTGGDNCHLTTVTPVTVGAPGSPNTVVVTGDSSGATAGECFSSPFIVWWEAFSIDKCADVVIDFCGTTPLLQPNYVFVAAGCAGDGATCAPTYTADTFARGLCGGGDQNITFTFDALPSGTYYYPIIADPAFNTNPPGPYIMNITAEECTGACTGCLGSCCDQTAETCQDDVAQDQCNGAGQKWSPRMACCATECRDPAGGLYGALDVEFLGNVTVTDMSASAANDIWAYQSPSGRKYAVVGLVEATAFVDVTDPRIPFVVDTVPDAVSTWSDMKTYSTFAYNVNESGGGMQIIDLTDIDDGVVTLLGSAAGGMATAHNVALNPVSGFAYPCGTDVGQGFLAFDLSNPANPAPAGAWNDQYVHDLYVHSYDVCPWAGRAGQPCELAYCFCGGAGFYIVDATDKANMTTISSLTYPTLAYCHQGWLSDDERYIFLNDELDELDGLVSQTRTYVVDVQDPANPFLATTYDHPGCWIDHNLIVQGERVYHAHYGAGLRVLDVQNPLSPSEIAHFDTHPEDNATDFVGVWGVHVGLPSRVILVSDRSRGLFVLCDRPDQPLPGFVVPDVRGNVGLPLAFDASSSTTCDAARSLVAYEWDFDYDGLAFDVDATGINPSHVYAAMGDYTVALRVTDDLGASQITSMEIGIDPAIPAVSTWGAAALLLLIAAAGSVIARARRQAVSSA